MPKQKYKIKKYLGMSWNWWGNKEINEGENIHWWMLINSWKVGKKEYERFKNKINEKISTGKPQYCIWNLKKSGEVFIYLWYSLKQKWEEKLKHAPK